MRRHRLGARSALIWTDTEAAAAQILVLLGLMTGQAITTAVLLRLMTHGLVVRRDLGTLYPR